MSFESQSFGPEELTRFGREVRTVLSEIAPRLKEHHGNIGHTTKTSDTDVVTELDLWAEETIRDRLCVVSSSIGFVGEETNPQVEDDVYWTVDGIDGTWQYVNGESGCSTMVSLVDHGVPVVASIHDFLTGQSYSAIAGYQAYVLGGEPQEKKQIYTSPTLLEEASLVVYTDEDTEHGRALCESLESMGAVVLRTFSAGETMTGVATGKLAGFVSLRNPYAAVWDVAPGALLIDAAGGKVRNIGESGFSVNNPNLIASNRVVFEALRSCARNNYRASAD